MACLCLKSNRRAFCRTFLLILIGLFTIPLPIIQLYYGSKNYDVCCVKENIYCSASGQVNISNSTGNVTLPPGVYSTKDVDIGLANWLLGDGIISVVQVCIIIVCIISYVKIPKKARIKWKKAIKWLVIFLFLRLVWVIYGNMIDSRSDACTNLEKSMQMLFISSIAIDITNLVFTLCLVSTIMRTL